MSEYYTDTRGRPPIALGDMPAGTLDMVGTGDSVLGDWSLFPTTAPTWVPWTNAVYEHHRDLNQFYLMNNATLLGPDQYQDRQSLLPLAINNCIANGKFPAARLWGNFEGGSTCFQWLPGIPSAPYAIHWHRATTAIAQLKSHGLKANIWFHCVGTNDVPLLAGLYSDGAAAYSAEAFKNYTLGFLRRVRDLCIQELGQQPLFIIPVGARKAGYESLYPQTMAAIRQAQIDLANGVYSDKPAFRLGPVMDGQPISDLADGVHPGPLTTEHVWTQLPAILSF